MSRPIKFRIYNTKEKKIVPIDLDLSNNILMQYSGLKDKYKREIYEGDIVKINNSMGIFFIAEVRFTDGCFEVYIYSSKQRDYLKCYVVNYAIKIIGNIYENDNLINTAI